MSAKIVRIERDGPNGIGLEEWETMDPTALESGTPVQRGYLYDAQESSGYLMGVWDCTAFDDAPGPYPVDEFMLLLEGSVTMAMPDGTEVTVKAGEAFILSQGLQCQWKQPDYVRKIFMIVENDKRKTSSNPSLTRVTVPSLTPSEAAEDTVLQSNTVFSNADGRMQVLRNSHTAAFEGPLLSDQERLITVLQGAITVGGETFTPMDTFYVTAGYTDDWQIAEGTVTLQAQYLKPS